LIHIVSYRVVSYLIVSCRILCYRIVSYLILSYLIVSYRIVSYRIVSYRIVSYHMWFTCLLYEHDMYFLKWDKRYPVVETIVTPVHDVLRWCRWGEV